MHIYDEGESEREISVFAYHNAIINAISTLNTKERRRRKQQMY